MTFLHAIRDDLVEKRLWPIAVALLLALVAIPVVLARGSEDVPAPVLPDPTVATAPVTGTAADPVVLAEAATTGAARPTGRFKDPFRGAGAGGGDAGDDDGGAADGTAVIVDPETPVPVPGGGAGGPSTTIGELGGGGSAGGSGSVTVEPAAPVAPSSPLAPNAPADRPATPRAHAAGYRVDLDWGPAADPRRVRDIARLDALEASGEPQVVFMGVRPDGRTALFLVVGEATGSGDARCRPSDDYCSLLEMRAGDTQFLDIVTDEGVRQHELYVDRVAEREADSAAAADERLERVAKGGRKLIAETIEAGRTFVRRYVYAEKLGVVKFVEDDEKRAAPRGLLETAE